MTEFPLQQCKPCGAVSGHSATRCRTCGGRSFQTVHIPGSGHIYASTTVRVPDSDFLGEEPFIVAVVDLSDAVERGVGREPASEPVRVTARIRENVDVRIGDSVVYDGCSDGIFWFDPA